MLAAHEGRYVARVSIQIGLAHYTISEGMLSDKGHKGAQ